MFFTVFFISLIITNEHMIFPRSSSTVAKHMVAGSTNLTVFSSLVDRIC